jgi:hypothetical protein
MCFNTSNSHPQRSRSTSPVNRSKSRSMLRLPRVSGTAILIFLGVVWVLQFQGMAMRFFAVQHNVVDTLQPAFKTPTNMHKGMKPRITHLTLTNYTPDQAFDPILPRVMDKESVYEHLDYYGLNKSQPLIFFITPTYRRTSQMVDLVRLGQTLHMDPGIYWIVVEDAENCSKRVRDLVERMGLPYAHMAVPTAKALQQKLRPHRGVDQRNRALEVVDSIGIPGVVYFGDDDNAYDGERNRAS